MKKQDRLFDFIKGLDGNEKRFFKLYSNLYTTNQNKNYLILFDVFDGLEEYDSEQVLKQTKKYFPKSKLPTVKRYLKSQLFKSLHLYHRDNNTKITTFDNLSIVEVLNQKKQIFEVNKVLASLEKKCSESENFLGLLTTIGYQITLLDKQISEGPSILNQIDDRYEMYLKEIDKFKEYMQIRKIHNKTRSIINALEDNQETKINALENIHQEIQLIRESNGFNSAITQYYYFYIEAMIYSYTDKNNSSKVTVALQQQLNVIQAHPLVFVDTILEYVCLINLCKSYLNQREIDNFFEVIESLDQMLKTTDHPFIHEIAYWRYLRHFEFYWMYPEEKIQSDVLKDFEKHCKSKKSL